MKFGGRFWARAVRAPNTSSSFAWSRIGLLDSRRTVGRSAGDRGGHLRPPPPEGISLGASPGKRGVFGR
eukprot:13262502-Alexandrium_andersonii.AAC.1